MCPRTIYDTTSLAQVRPDRAARAAVQVRRASRPHRRRRRDATETRRRDTGDAGRRAMVHARHDLLRRTPEGRKRTVLKLRL